MACSLNAEVLPVHTSSSSSSLFFHNFTLGRQNVAPAVAVINGSQSQGLIHTSVFAPSFPNEGGLFGGPHSGQVLFRDGGGVKKVRWTTKDEINTDL